MFDVWRMIMKKYIIILLTICLSLSMVACSMNNNVSDSAETDDIKTKQAFYLNAEKVEICIGESKFCFERSEDVKAICGLFEDIVGSKVPSDAIPTEGFYEITFYLTDKKTTVILTGSTIIIDGVEYYTNKDIVKPLSEYLK